MNEMRPPRAKARKHDISAIASRYDRVALVLQGGGALGAYQIGVHQALAEAGCEPNWISGAGKTATKSRSFLVHYLRAQDLGLYVKPPRGLHQILCALRRIGDSA
jgi:hypothetical protein